LANKVITWIVYAVRPLFLDELRHALAVSAGDTDLDRDDIPDVADLISVCAGVVTLDEERDVIRLVHYTAQDFFERIGHDWCPNAQQMMASTCLTYLGIDPFESYEVRNRLYVPAVENGLKLGFKHEMRMKSVHTRCKQYFFLAYAAIFWSHHAVTVQEEVSCIALPFLLDGKLVCSTVRILHCISSRFSGYDEGWTGIHYAAFLGLEILLERLLRIVVKSSIGSNISNGYTPLLLAIRQGHETAVRVLLNHGVDANGGGRTRKPLSYAAECGREDMVKLLLSKDDVDVNSVDQQMLILRRFAPLHYAVDGGHTPVVKLLLQDERVDVNLRSMTGKGEASHTALTLAVENNDICMVRLLLGNRNVNPNAKGEAGSLPLSGAASKGYRETLSLLLEHPKIDPDLRDDCQRWQRWRAPGRLMVQLAMGYPDVEFTGRDVNGGGDTPLSAAAAAGHLEIVKTLIERGKPVNVNLRDVYGESALSKAAYSGHLAIVKMLLDHAETDPNIANNGGMTPLLDAALYGHVDLFRMLLVCNGINPNAQDIGGLTPLLVAAGQGFVEIVKLLLECEDIDPNIPNIVRQTPLSAATSEGQEAVVSLLLQCDKVNATMGGRPLLYEDMEEQQGTLKSIFDMVKYRI
jgi:ankyrin repeat protein